jgi:hypothetical protein
MSSATVSRRFRTGRPVPWQPSIPAASLAAERATFPGGRCGLQPTLRFRLARPRSIYWVVPALRATRTQARKACIDPEHGPAQGKSCWRSLKDARLSTWGRVRRRLVRPQLAVGFGVLNLLLFLALVPHGSG